MPKPNTATTIVSTYEHHYQHFENLQMSAQEFYKYLDETIATFQYPEIRCYLKTFFHPGFLFDVTREYLCVQFQDLRYYICAAPFGKSYFISWWFNDEPSRFKRFLQHLWVIGRIFRHKKNMYDLDRELIFCNSIEQIVDKAVKKIIADKGFTIEKLEAVV